MNSSVKVDTINVQELLDNVQAAHALLFAAGDEPCSFYLEQAFPQLEYSWRPFEASEGLHPGGTAGSAFLSIFFK